MTFGLRVSIEFCLIFIRKTTISGGLENSSGEWMHTSMVFEPLKEIDLVSQVCSSGEWIRTTDLRVMSENPESCH